MKEIGGFETGRLVQGELTEDLREVISREDELNPRLSGPQYDGQFRALVVFRSAASSVPFKWEEAPGKARASCKELSKSGERQLQLPPRLQLSNRPEMRRIPDQQTFYKGQQTKLRQLVRRHSIEVDSRKNIQKVKSYVRAITSQPRSTRCVFAPKDHKFLEAAPAGGFSAPMSPAHEPDSPPDSPRTDVGAVSTASSNSTWCPDLSPDGDDCGCDRKARRKQAMERLVKFVSSWAMIDKVRRKKPKANEPEMWSPTLATYLYNKRKAEGDSKPSEPENWEPFGRLKVDEEDGDSVQETEEDSNSSFFLDDCFTPKTSSLPETVSPSSTTALSKPKLAFTFSNTMRLLLSPLHRPHSLPPRRAKTLSM